MKTYQRLSGHEREEIAILKNRGWSLRKIAILLRRSHSSLSRELKRNSHREKYYPLTAQQRAYQRLHLQHHNVRKLHCNLSLQKKVVRQLKKGWSPEIIAGRLKHMTGRSRISHEAIYQWIYAQSRHLIPHLVRSRPRRRPRHFRPWPKRLISHRVFIDQRPPEANQRLVTGHWETDTLWGQGSAAIQVAVERKTRFVRLRKIPRKSAQASFEALSDIFADVREDLRKTITYDNGPENALHTHLNRRFNIRSYFCQPYHSWEKGTVENTNGLIRRFLPKKTNFDTLRPQIFSRLEHWLNSRPRKCLDFKTPAEAYFTSGALDY